MNRRRREPIHSPARRAVPRWDPERRELWLGDTLIKKFLRPAPLQELILAALEEESWPERIYDPLPPVPGQNAKERLHSTIKKLNRGRRSQRITFHGDGSGEAVRWTIEEGT
jgi:hypothetical protein